MQTNVSTLLRDFPKVRRAAFRGERVIIKTKDGDLILTAARSPANQILGSLKDQLTTDPQVDFTLPTSDEREWMK